MSVFETFYEKCCELNGQVIQERELWNTEVTAQAIRHFAQGICDDNPLWLDAAYAASGPYGRIAAPPSFIASVNYPLLHGAPVAVPMANLANGLEMEWFKPILLGARLDARSVQTDVKLGRDRSGRRVIYVSSETEYTHFGGEVICRAKGVIAWVERPDEHLLSNRKIHAYTEQEIQDMEKSILCRERTGNVRLNPASIQVGDLLPERVHPPFSIGDLVCWESATGPRYRPGALGYADGLKKPHGVVKNPVTGWNVNKGQAHFDAMLAGTRGLHAPFDNVAMRFSWISAMLTDWMGDHGILKRLKINVAASLFYGDASFYSGKIIRKTDTFHGIVFTISIVARNQLQEIVSAGEAEVILSFEDPPIAELDSDEMETTYQNLRPRNPQVLGPGSVGRIERFALERPGGIAVRDLEVSLTYRDLNQRANRLAHSLIVRGVEENVAVGVHLPRGADWIVSVVAILKAGGVYVPVDLDLPVRRILHMLRDARVAVLISTHGFRESFPSSSLKHICLQKDQLLIGSQDSSNPAKEIRGDAFAYVMYTSGSTGMPKGVAVTHQALEGYMQVLSNTLPLAPSDIYLNTASFSFSASIRQTLYPLACGIAQVVANEEQRRDPLLLSRLINSDRISVWDTVPSVWAKSMERMLFACERDALELPGAHLDKIFLTGEALPRRLPGLWRKRFHASTKIVNLYSQTETTGSVAFYDVPLVEDLDHDNKILPVGICFPDVEIRLLEGNELKTLAAGVYGEICVFSPRLAAGYLNESELTRQRFVSNDNASQGVEHYYRTGDFASVLPDGNLQFTGRADRRSKIRGFRVDLGEVESVLNKHPQVLESVVVVNHNNKDAERLTAFFVPKSNNHGLVDTLRNYLKDILAEYMIPSSFVQLDVLPRTHSGKLDRDALVDTVSVDQLPNDALPRNETEQKLITIWQEVIGTESVGIRDDFFEFGGDSLSALTLVSEIEKEFNTTLPLDAIFKLTTIESLSGALERHEDTGLVKPFSEGAIGVANPGKLPSLPDLHPRHFRKMLAIVSGRKGVRPRPESLMVNITPENENPPLFFCANGQHEVVSLARALGNKQPLYFLESGYVVWESRDSYIRSLAAHHIVDLLQLCPSGPYLLLGYSFGCNIVLEMAKQLNARGKEVSFLGLLDARIGMEPGYKTYRYHVERRHSVLLMYLDRFRRSASFRLTGKVSGKRSIYEADQIIRDSDVEPSTALLPRYQVNSYAYPICLFRASRHVVRNLLFPNAGLPVKDFPRLKIIPVPGNHHSMIHERYSHALASEIIPLISAVRPGS